MLARRASRDTSRRDNRQVLFQVLYARGPRSRRTVKALQTAKTKAALAEGWRVRKDGSRFWASVVIDAIRDERGELIGFAKITRDVTERQEAQQRLIESERRYRRLIDSVVDYAIFQLDMTGVIAPGIRAPSVSRDTPEAEIVGQTSDVLHGRGSCAGVPDRLSGLLPKGHYEAEGWRVRKDGSRFWASVVIDAIMTTTDSWSALPRSRGTSPSAMRLSKLLKKTQEQLAASQKMEAMGQLSGGIAHDFNNLLMIVLGNLETRQKHGGEAQARTPTAAGIEQCHARRQRAAALTSRLLAFSRRQALDPKPMDVSKIPGGFRRIPSARAW